MTMTTTNDTPRVWIGCLACYNAGRLVGEWYDATDAGDITPEDVHGRATSHEELWCFDHENFAGVLTGECSPMEATRLADALNEVDDSERAAFAAWVAHQDGDINEPDRFHDQYRGEWDSISEYAYSFATDTAASHEAREMMDSPPWPFSIDWTEAGEQLERDGDIATVQTPDYNVWVFEPNA